VSDDLERPGSGRPRIPWNVVYFLLAGFDLLTVSSSLYLTQRLFDSYNRAVSQNQEWARHMAEYAELQQLAGEVNAPGNDVFETHAAAEESARTAAARKAFDRRVAELRAHLAGAHPQESRGLLSDFDAIAAAMAEMEAQAETIFAEFGAGQPERAAGRMAVMDRKYAHVLTAFHGLRRDVTAVQQRLFAEQAASARNLQRFEFLIGTLIVCMLGGAILYGRRIQEAMRVEAEIREGYRAQLEQRVIERTAALQDSEAALATAASDWRRTFDAIDSPVMVLDMDGRLLRANATVQALVGHTGDITGLLLTSLGRGEPWTTAARLADETRRSFKSRSAEAVDPETGSSWDVGAFLVDRRRGGGAGRIIVVAKDTTRLLELRETLRREENMAAMGTLVAGVAHEVRNPLFAISSTLDAFEARFGDTPGLEKYFPILRGETERLSRLMRDLLEYGRPPRMETTPVGLHEVVADAVKATEADAAAAGVDVVSDVPESLPPLMADPQRLAQVFQNVIHNAVSHTPSGGAVRVQAVPRDAQGRRWIEASVRDGGPGFRPADLPHVFRPLFSRRAGGTGLGLAIAQRIVESHGGVVAAANAPGGGAVVTVRLPVDAATREDAPALG